ncbi:MAG TPA: VanZ family protein [Burkholderiales bacterium]|nr:VanZ family protein [Burkholderiales bacterium]
MESADQQRAARAPRGLLARVLAIAYFVVIAYASLQPFRGWWVPPEEIRLFLTAPWPRYITLEDVVVNIAAYVPLGFLLARACMRSYGIRRAVFVAAALASLTSVAMETVQMFMPARIASNVDVLTNSLGGLLGALAAPMFAPTQSLGIRLARAREQWFVYGPSADVGLVLVCLWLVTQLHPAAQLFGTGNLRDTFDLPVWFFHQPQLLLSAEAAVVGLNLLGVGLIIVALTRETQPRGAVTAAVLGAGIAAKALTALALSKTAAPWAWITPGVMLGVLVGGVVLYGLTHVGRRAQWVAACVSFAAGIAIINVGPENPYQTLPPQLIAGGATHFLSFSGIVRALSELWPFLALVYAAAVAGKRPSA